MQKIWPLFLILILFTNCSTPRPSGKTEAEILYKEAEELVKESRFIQATEKLNTIRSNHPYSYYATHAELLAADVLYQQENFGEAAAAYIVFKDFHPKHQKLEYVIYRIAESFYNQLPSTYDRDLAPGVEAIKHYNDLMRIFPNTAYASTVLKRVNKVKKMFINKAKYIADFYYKTEVYDSARFRYLAILKKFEETKLRRHSIFRVVEASIKLDDLKGCKDYADQYSSELSKKEQLRMLSMTKICRVN